MTKIMLFCLKCIFLITFYNGQYYAFIEVHFSGCASWDFIFVFLLLSYSKIILNLLFSVRVLIDLIIYGFIKANDL